MDLRRYIKARCRPDRRGCWIWQLSVGSHGYGNASTPTRRVALAHRVSYEAFHGPIPDGALVQHSCDNKRCVAPHHLSLGTDATNADDKTRKGRAAKKLTADAVREIRAATGSLRSIGVRYGVNAALVGRIRNRQIWQHVA